MFKQKTVNSTCLAIVTVAFIGCSAETGVEEPTLLDEELGTNQELLSAPDEEYVETPVGRLHQTCVVEVADNAEVKDNPRCRYKAKLASAALAATEGAPIDPTVNGWVENSYRNASSSPYWFGKVLSRWYVPANPQVVSNQLLYYFPGLQNTSGTLSIIQPVMQWGNNGRFGGNYWSIASWYVDTAGTTYYSTPRTVTTGQIIDGTMTSSSCSASGSCTWSIKTAIRGGASTTLTLTPGKVYNWAAPAALEAYRLTSCDHYPNQNSVALGTDLYLGTSSSIYTASWSTTVRSVTPSCHYSVTNSPNPGASYLYAY